MIPATFQERMSKLVPVEEKYFRIMWAKYGVLFITAKPGVAKSAIARSIADKMGFQYMDIRLSMVDETDVGLFPSVTEEVNDGETIKCLDHVVPRWAVDANAKPTIIHFEELNRASQAVRNAALQILLEREIGTKFKFNDNVLLMASGNLGDEDNTDVEEFDSALNNRLIHIRHGLTGPEWIKNYAKENVHPSITNYIGTYPENLYKYTEDDAAYASPRSWTMLSELIIQNYGREASPQQFLPFVKEVAFGYVGNGATKYIKYCEDLLRINIDDVLNNFDKIKDELKTFNRDKSSELIQAFREKDLKDLSSKQIRNAVKFLNTIGEDEKVGYLLSIIDNNSIDIAHPRIKEFLLNFKHLLKDIKKRNNPEDDLNK